MKVYVPKDNVEEYLKIFMKKSKLEKIVQPNIKQRKMLVLCKLLLLLLVDPSQD